MRGSSGIARQGERTDFGRPSKPARIGLTPVRAFFVQPKQRSRRLKSDSENFLKFTGLMM